LGGVAAKGAGATLGPRARGAAAKVDADRVHAWLVEHPGARAEDMSAALGTDSSGLRPALQELRSEGRARTEGKARATRYYAEAR
jgi:predicted transcriptional regulator